MESLFDDDLEISESDESESETESNIDNNEYEK